MFRWLVIISVICFALGSNVELINDNNYEEFVQNYTNVFLMYFRKQHSYSSLIRPRFHDAANRAPESVRFAKIECSQTGKKTCERAKKFGQPEFVFFKNGHPIGEHRGNRDKRAFLDFIQEMIADNVAVFERMEDLETYFDDNNDKTTAVGFFEGEDPFKASFLKLADKLRQRLNFAIVTFIPEENNKRQVALYQPKLFRTNLEPNYILFPGEKTEFALGQWIKDNEHGVLRYRKIKNAWQFQDDKPSVITYFRVDFSSSDKYSLDIRNRILKVAQKFNKHFNFYISSTAEYQQDLLQYGFQEDIKANKPTVTVKYNKKKYLMEDPFSTENMVNFLENLLKGKLKPFIISEDPPEAKGPVKEVVGKNIEQEIASERNNIIIMFYATWCKASQKLAMKLESLAEKVASDNVVFMKMDAVSNDVPYPFVATDFPTVYWIPQNDKKHPVLYKGGHDLTSLTNLVSGRVDSSSRHARDEL